MTFKVDVTSTEVPVFHPVTISLTCSTPQQLKVLKACVGLDVTVSRRVADLQRLTQEEALQLQTMLIAIYNKIEVFGKENGHVV